MGMVIIGAEKIRQGILLIQYFLDACSLLKVKYA